MNSNTYNGVLQRPFLFEHAHKGIMSAFAMALPAWIFARSSFTNSDAVALLFAGIIGGAIVTVVLAQHEGFSIDLPSRRYRYYTWVAGLRVGKWQPLPGIVAVQMRPLQKRHALPLESHPVQLGTYATEHTWQVLLSVENSPIGLVAAYADEGKALRIATELGKLLAVPLVKHEDYCVEPAQHFCQEQQLSVPKPPAYPCRRVFARRVITAAPQCPARTSGRPFS